MTGDILKVRVAERLEALGKKPIPTATAAGLGRDSITDILSGKKRSVRGDTLAKLAEALETTAEYLLGNSIPAPAPRGVRTIPVISWVAAGTLSDPATQIPEGTETIEISGLPAGDYFATRVSGDSMDRFSPPGSLILVNRAETDLIRGRRYIFSLRGETTYKRWEPDPDRLVPESTNPTHEPIFPKSDRDWSVIGRVRITLFDEL